MAVREAVLRGAEKPVGVRELSTTLADSGGSRVGLARCFVGSLFLASEGRVAFQTGSGGELEVVLR